MISGPACQIERTGREIVVHLRSDLFSECEVSRFLDFLELESIRRRSGLSEAEAAALAAEIDRSAWQRTRPSVEPQGEIEMTYQSELPD